MWKLLGYDTFDGMWYALQGEYESEWDARAAAQQRLMELERTQPTESSGGQSSTGIQDRVFIVRPDGTKYRFTSAA
jgi:hypothetical protein